MQTKIPMASHEAEPRGWFGKVRGDFLPSIVTFLVALPLCMGIAIASGVPVAAGLVTGIVGGLLVGMISGAPLQVSGPAAGLAVINYDFVSRHGLEMLGLAVLLGGAVQLTAGLLRLGQWFRAVSPAVIRGMLAGIGVLIFASQFHVMVDDAPKGSGLENLITIPAAIQKGLPLPEWHSREERAFRAEHLKAFGTLHNRQIGLQEAVGEVIPEAATPEQAQAQAGGLQPLVARQEAIRSDLQALIAEMETFALLSGDDPKAERLRAATQTALAATAAALQDLEQGNVAAVRASQETAEQSVLEIQAGLKNHQWAAKLGLLTILIIVGWKVVAPRRLKILPAPLVAVVLATAAAAALSLPVLYIEVPTQFVDDLHFLSLTVLREADWGVLIQGGLMIAAVASAETLLCATAVDQMHQGRRAQYNRELSAQGVGNMICGLFGALPMTGVIVRSGTNVQAGARTRWSAVMHGLWLLVFVVLLAGVLQMIPVAALAAMLVYTGYKLVNPQSVKELWKYGWGEVAIYAATAGTIVAVDLLAGVILGLVLSAVKLLVAFSRLNVQMDMDSDHTHVVRLRGAATFLQLPLLAQELERLPRHSAVRIDAERLQYIDHACLDLLQSWTRQHEATGGRVRADWTLLHSKYRSESEVMVRTPQVEDVARVAG